MHPMYVADKYGNLVLVGVGAYKGIILPEFSSEQAGKILAVDSTGSLAWAALSDFPRFEKVLSRDGLGKDYLYDYTRKIAEEANGHTKAKALTFLWVTDTHSYEDSTWIGSVAAQMTNYVPCSFIAHTGDIIDGLVSPAEGLSTLSELNRNRDGRRHKRR